MRKYFFNHKEHGFFRTQKRENQVGNPMTGNSRVLLSSSRSLYGIGNVEEQCFKHGAHDRNRKLDQLGVFGLSYYESAISPNVSL